MPSIVTEYGIVQGVDPEAFGLCGTENEVDGKGWERLDWVADEKMWKECRAATERANAIINNSDDSVLWFDSLGVNGLVRSSSFFLFHPSKLNFIRLLFFQQATTIFPQMHSSKWQSS